MRPTSFHILHSLTGEGNLRNIKPGHSRYTFTQGGKSPPPWYHLSPFTNLIVCSLVNAVRATCDNQKLEETMMSSIHDRICGLGIPYPAGGELTHSGSRRSSVSNEATNSTAQDLAQAADLNKQTELQEINRANGDQAALCQTNVAARSQDVLEDDKSAKMDVEIVDQARRKRQRTGSLQLSPEKGVIPNLPGGKMKAAYKKLADEHDALKARMLQAETREKRMTERLQQQGNVIKQQQEEILAMKRELQRMAARHQGQEIPASSQCTSGYQPSQPSIETRQQQQGRQRSPPQQQGRQKQQKLQQRPPVQQKPQQKPHKPQQKLQRLPEKPQQGLQQRPQEQQEPRCGAEPNCVAQAQDNHNPTWVEVVRGKKRATKKAEQPARPPKVAKKEEQLLQRRAPRGGAVILKKASEEITYADLIKKARANISLVAMGIVVQRTRYTAKGEMLLELQAAEEALIDAFAERLRVVLAGDALVLRPVRTTTLLLLDIHESVTDEEILAGLCQPPGLRLYGRTPMGRGCHSVKAVAPITVALQILQQGRIPIGWSMCRVRSLEPKQRSAPQCYKCLRSGHMAAQCEGTPITGCYRCGEEGHQIRDCRVAPKCPVCSQEEGRDAAHIVGGAGCLAAKQTRGRQQKRKSKQTRR